MFAFHSSRMRAGVSTMVAAAAAASPSFSQTIDIEIDASELSRRLLGATIRLDVKGDDVALWYPKWVPGIHGPGGPVQNLAGLDIADGDGNPVRWQRDPDDVYRVLVESGGELVINLRYITNQPSVNSDGCDSFGSDLIGFVSANTVMLYPEGWDKDEVRVSGQIRLPADWEIATALDIADLEADDDGSVVSFEETSLRRFIDSPMLCGAHLKTYDLVDPDVDDITIPPHRLRVISEIDRNIRIDETWVTGYTDMVTQTARLFGDHPFPSFDILLGVSDLLRRNGLEHLTSSFNVLGLDALDTETSLKGWDRNLVPHEYVHAWCGKHRRPTGMVSSDFHTPKDTRLLWVYEGLTQYLGEVVEARAGMMTADEYRWNIRNRLRWAMSQQGREWRTLDDTGAAAYLLRSGSRAWSTLRRGQDFYYEGSLLWLEADARIRNLTDGTRSLDDFCQLFFSGTEDGTTPRGYDRAEVVSTLDQVAADDWDTFLRERTETPTTTFELGLLDEIGYLVQYSNDAPDPPDGVDANQHGVDCTDSIGADFWGDGNVGDVLEGTPAHEAGLGPGMRVAGVDGYVWSRERMQDALDRSVGNGEIELLMVSGDTYITRTVIYDGGPRHLVLIRDDEKVDRIEEILAPRD